MGTNFMCFKAKASTPMVVHAAWRAASTCCEDICSSLLLHQTAQTGVSSIVPRYVRFNLRGVPIAKQGKGLHHLFFYEWLPHVFGHFSVYWTGHFSVFWTSPSKLSDGTKMSWSLGGSCQFTLPEELGLLFWTDFWLRFILGWHLEHHKISHRN